MYSAWRKFRSVASFHEKIITSTYAIISSHFNVDVTCNFCKFSATQTSVPVLYFQHDKEKYVLLLLLLLHVNVHGKKLNKYFFYFNIREKVTL